MVIFISPKTVDLKFARLIAAFAVAVVIPCSSCKRPPTSNKTPIVSERVDGEKEALARVEQDRGEPTGRSAVVNVPEQLKHYANRHRFLAVQAADFNASDEAAQVDFVDVVKSIENHELVEMKTFGDDYILYGVGQNVSGNQFEHYDAASHEGVPRADNEQTLKQIVQQASDDLKQNNAMLAGIEAELRRTGKRDRTRRAELSKQLARSRATIAAARLRSKLLSNYYSDAKRRKLLLAEFQLLSGFARDVDRQTYDLNNVDERRRLKIKLLSFIRPEARDVLLEIARAYKQKFERPLPISSLVRPVQYQRELAATNPNAVRVATPPHSTGSAFDIYYGNMTAAEQQYLMTFIANLKDEGRVEALREERDNIHVYVFRSGRRPDEKLVARAIAEASPRRAVKTKLASHQRHSARAHR